MKDKAGRAREQYFNICVVQVLRTPMGRVTISDQGYCRAEIQLGHSGRLVVDSWCPL